ncbi:RsmB/NOP family class I SAM-dependent RNA methyltransferase [Corynebacterium choanae]|uniref:RsmB/NOP family class I SAM-dependent RNA methyltransferase n=1 Tax=Corynebacterium choanae TaxID=1862358 RepID=UPI001FE919BB|nr:transcription antitermination factor NusB [Corynebacterium choanae]
MHGVDKARQVAVTVLTRVREDEAYANLLLPNLLEQSGLIGRDAAFATEITYGTLRTIGVLDTLLDEISSRPLNQLDGVVLDCLRLGVYQVLYTRVEAHAAVDTTVRLAQGLVGNQVTGFVNALMRTATRLPAKQWFARLAPQDPLANLAFHHAHPVWIAEALATALAAHRIGDVAPAAIQQALADPAMHEELGRALAADSARPVVHLVARPGELTVEELCALTGAEPATYSPYGAYLPGGRPGDDPIFAERLASVQDEGSQLIARLAATAPLDGADQGRWLDLCAGPGGKAALLTALATIDGAHVDAVEPMPHRAALVRQALQGLDPHSWTVHVGDGRSVELAGEYDRILVDAPCSGLGALRRRPEARWRKTADSIPELNTLQQALLDRAIQLVRPGGIVVYATCSPHVEETRHIVDTALAAHPEITEQPVADLLCGMPDTGAFASAQMWPHLHGTDAMFVSLLRKSPNLP